MVTNKLDPPIVLSDAFHIRRFVYQKLFTRETERKRRTRLKYVSNTTEYFFLYIVHIL